MTGRSPWVELLVTAAAVVAAWQILWRKLVKPMVRGLRRLAQEAERIIGAAERVDAIETKVSAIRGEVAGVATRLQRVEKELHPNGGDSLRDVVDRVEGKVS